MGAHHLWLPYPLVVPGKEKPYRVYRGGRVKGPVKPLGSLDPEPPPSPASGDGRPPLAPGYPEYPGPPGPSHAPPRRRGRRVAFWTALILFLAVLVVVGWGLAGYFSFRSGVKEANRRLPAAAEAALSPQDGSLLSSPSTILLLGADAGPAREGDTGRSDSIVLVRADPDHHRIALLSIPRDLRVEIPGYGVDKINAAYAYGGPSLTIRTVEDVTGLEINHVVVVDFPSFAELIDALDGVTIDVPKRIVSNRFDCPYGTKARCERWPGWQFEPGRQTMDGKHALIYSRIRENRLDPSETDVTRGVRQQQVVQAIADEVVSLPGFVRLPFIGDDVTTPLATDLSASELLKLGWVKFRASDESTLRCRLGGVAEEIDGVWYLAGTEENVSVIGMVTGETAPQPPPPSQGPYAPGCQVGR